MFSIELHPIEPSALALDRALRAIEEENLKLFEDACLTNVSFNFGSTSLTRQAVSAPSLALSLAQVMFALPAHEAMGLVYCNNEPCFFFRSSEDLVLFTKYNPEDISDMHYHNELGAASSVDVLASVTSAMGMLGRILSRYTGGKSIRPDDQVWGLLSTMSNNPFICQTG